MFKNALGYTDYVVIGCTLILSAAVGIYFRFTGGHQRTTDEYLMGDKAMGIGPVAFSLMASLISAIAVLGTPAECYMYGTQMFMSDFGLPIGCLIAAYGLLPVYFDLNVSTSYEYLEKRFGRTTRTIASFMFILSTVFYMSVVVYAPSVALNAVTGFSTWNLVLTFVILATFYCYMGGLKAVLWTDVFQAILMYIPLLAVVLYAFIKKGPTEIFNSSKDRGQLIFFNMTPDPTIRYTFWNCIISSLFYGICTYGTNQTQVQRMLSVGDLKRAQWALFYAILLIIAFDISCFSAGVIMSAMFHDCDPLFDPHAHLSSQDQLLVYLILQKFAKIPGLVGLCMAGILSAAFSTLSSTLNSLSSVTVEDFIKPFCFCKRLTDSWIAHIAKLLAIFFGGSCLLLVFMVANFRGVLEASAMLDSFLSGPVFGVYILGFFTTTANETGVLIGLIAGMFFSGWITLGAYVMKVSIPTLPRRNDTCPVSMNDILWRNEKLMLNTTSDMIYNAQNPLVGDRYVFPLYKISYMWFFVIGLTVTVIVGFIASFVARFCMKSPHVDVRYLSPFVRRLHTNTTEKLEMQNLYEEIALLDAVDVLEEE